METLLNAAQAIHNKNNGKNASPVTPAMYWGESPIMQQLRSLVEKVAITDANILITGENGTGKEMLAREIHALSSRRTKEMIAVDMGAITESLFESELFGHTKGSLQMHTLTVPVSSKQQTIAHCFSMKSAIYPITCKPNY